MSRFVVANHLAGEVRRAFRERPHLVDGAPGYVRMEVISPRERPDEFWLITTWTDRESFERWHRSDAHRRSHAGIPRGLRLVPGETEVRYFDLVAE